MQVVIDIQMNTEKFGSGVEITGVQVINWWTHGWTSTDGYAYNQQDTKII